MPKIKSAKAKKIASINKKREDNIAKILSKVHEICDYAVNNLCTELAHFEELELMLRDIIK